MSEDRQHWSFYGTKTLQLVPYMIGTPVYTDEMLPFLYRQTRDEGKIESVFCGDSIRGDAFVSFFDKRKTLQVLCEVEDDKTLKVCGYSWIDLPRGVDGARAAMSGFCFFSNAGKRDSARDLGRLGLAYWMIAMKCDVIHGVLLESNTAARNYALHLGFRDVGIVPKYHYMSSTGELVGARVMIIEKPEFMAEFDIWIESQKPVAEPV